MLTVDIAMSTVLPFRCSICIGHLMNCLLKYFSMRTWFLFSTVLVLFTIATRYRSRVFLISFQSCAKRRRVTLRFKHYTCAKFAIRYTIANFLKNEKKK